MVDNDGFVRVGGWLERVSLSYEESYFLILLSLYYVISFLIKYYYEKV